MNSSCSMTCLLQTTAVGIPRREGSTAAVTSLDGDTRTSFLPKPTCVGTCRRHSGIFFPFFCQNSCRGGTPCTTHPCGTANKPRGLRGRKEKKKEEKEGSALYWVSFPFLKCFLWILGEELKRGEQLYQKAWEAGSGKSHLVVMWV